ncbi:hypothetical protein [Myroides odoratimimus]|uniref:hypothetical protein n=1 Tax=Myroides odoratimimus TaxID=76832 RepID=UPI00310129A4
MEIKNKFLHHIDTEQKKISQITLITNSDNLENYITSLIDEITKEQNKRIFKFKEGNTEVKSSLSSILQIEDNLDEIISNNALRLLEKEIQAQEFLTKRSLEVNVQKGSLLHLHFIHEDFHHIIICKVEHDEFLTEDDFELKKGLNTQKKAFKAILISYDQELLISRCVVFDKNNSRYWWKEFLELEQLNTDDANTEKSLDEIDKVLNRQKKNYYPDYLILRNSMIGYYRTKEEFNFSDLVNDVFTTYEPLNLEFPLTDLISKINDLPTKKGFDTQFSIVKEKINKRIKTQIKLANHLYLNINDYIEDLKNVIETVEEHGNKYVKILSAEGYDLLKDMMQNGRRNN